MVFNSSWCLCCFGSFLFLHFFHLCCGLLGILIFLFGVNFPQFVLALDGRWERERWFDEIQREDAHISIEAVLSHLQRSTAGTRHQLLLLQDENVVGFLAGLERVKNPRQGLGWILHGAVLCELIYAALLRYLCWAKDGRHLQLPVILLFPGVNDQSDVAAAAGGKFPESSNNVVLDCKPEQQDMLWYFQMCPIQRNFKKKDRFATYVSLNVLTCLLRDFPGPSWTAGYLWWHGWCHTCRQRAAWCPELSCQQGPNVKVFLLVWPLSHCRRLSLNTSEMFSALQ